MNAPDKQSKFDKMLFGTIIGIVVPFISIVVFYYTSFTKVPFLFFLKHSNSLNILPKLVSIGALPNLGIFFLFMWRNHLRAAKGIILATLILAFLVIIMQLFL
jgi:hypothetical protein